MREMNPQARRREAIKRNGGWFKPLSTRECIREAEKIRRGIKDE